MTEQSSNYKSSAVNVVHLFMFRTFKLNLGLINSYFGFHGILCLTSTQDALSIEASKPQSRIHLATQPQKHDIE